MDGLVNNKVTPPREEGGEEEGGGDESTDGNKTAGVDKGEGSREVSPVDSEHSNEPLATLVIHIMSYCIVHGIINPHSIKLCYHFFRRLF